MIIIQISLSFAGVIKINPNSLDLPEIPCHLSIKTIFEVKQPKQYSIDAGLFLEP